MYLNHRWHYCLIESITLQAISMTLRGSVAFTWSCPQQKQKEKKNNTWRFFLSLLQWSDLKGANVTRNPWKRFIPRICFIGILKLSELAEAGRHQPFAMLDLYRKTWTNVLLICFTWKSKYAPLISKVSFFQ